MHWPQITMIVLLAMSFAINAVKHGEPKNTRYNILGDMIRTLWLVGLLYAGGFFG